MKRKSALDTVPILKNNKIMLKRACAVIVVIIIALLFFSLYSYICALYRSGATNEHKGNASKKDKLTTHQNAPVARTRNKKFALTQEKTNKEALVEKDIKENTEISEPQDKVKKNKAIESISVQGL